MRFDRYISNTSGLSRSEAHRVIRSGEAQLNGTAARFASVVTAADTVTLNGERLTPARHIYLAINKPAGYICATEDGGHPTVLDILGDADTAKHPTEPLQIVGRLDIDTTGLVLLTTDGKWNHRVASPNGKCHKTYEVALAEPLADSDIALLEKGIILRSESKPTRPCRIFRRDFHKVTIELNEGKYHQVKRMFAAVGNRVIQLHRAAIGGITCNGLAEGNFRALTEDEINLFS
jgi:16S rRNA pseudouridine516 synthase